MCPQQLAEIIIRERLMKVMSAGFKEMAPAKGQRGGL
jgi:hypothetical protein